jgi:ribosomal protein L37E
LVKYCPRCGNASYDSAPKCGNCGYNFAQESTKEESKKQYSIKNQLLKPKKVNLPILTNLVLILKNQTLVVSN